MKQFWKKKKSTVHGSGLFAVQDIKKKFADETEGKISYNERIKINFNFLEKFYFFMRRKLESRKKSRKNY